MAKEKKYPKAIYNWPEDERPRERLLKFGADKLSDTELLAILLTQVHEKVIKKWSFFLQPKI